MFLLIFFFYIPFNGFLAQVITPPTQFPYGVYLSKGDSLNQVTYEYVDDLGMNTVIQYANGDNAALKDVLNKYNLVAIKNDSQNDAVAYYSAGYYTKWEAEDTTKNELETGIKADFGSATNYSNTACWTSGTDLDNTNNIMLRGPQYRQDKKYSPWYMDELLQYNLRFNVAVSTINGITPEPTDPVCKVSVIFTYINDQGITIDYPLEGAELTLYVSSFTGESFEPFEIVYSYPPEFEQYNSKMEGLNQYELLDYDDTYPGTGIQFKVTWFGNKQLYIDNFQVFDVNIGSRIVDLYPQVVFDITSFANKYNGWDNIKYFFNVSEPQTIDRYTPMKIVDDILEAMNKPKGIAEFFPQWNGWRNGDRTIYKFKEMANPEKIMMEFITFVEGKPMEEMYEYQRYLLTEVSDVNPVFWHESLIAEPTLPDGSKCWLYSPPPEKLNASILLSLSFGAKGVFFWMLTSTDLKYEVNCNNNVWYKNILDENYLPNEPLYGYIKNDLSPRINGVLGSTLMNLSYTGNDLMLRDVTHPFIENLHYSNIDYLSLTNNPVNNPINSTLNFFATDLVPSTNDYSNNYFLMTNLITDGSRVAEMNVQSSEGVEGRYKNTRLRNIEPEYNFDITFYDDTTLTYTFPAGEGYLFQVAPVVLYGGRLLYNETVGGGWTLYDDMIIENGATLTVTGTYNANANITVKDGGSIKTVDGGSIIFYNGKQLIIEGLATVKGTITNKLTLDFVSPENENGILVKSGSDFTLSNCIVKNAEISVNGLADLLPHQFENLNINNTTFDNCNSGIAITGNVVVDLKIKQCSITNSQTAVSLTNLNKGTIQSNFINNSECGIILNQSSNINVVGNSISSSQNELPGIEMISSGGTIRLNTISGHSTGLLLGGSSPKIGDNTITGNLINGIYVGANSNPDLRAMLGGNPPNQYPISGHNEIFNNGGYNALGNNEDDGSEIYLSITGKIKLADGCNQIMDDRLPDFAFLDTTFTLMNGDTTTQVKADTNSWGTTNVGDPAGRFGILNVQYIPYLTEPCIIPQGGGLMIITQTASGEVIDTVYSTGEVVSDVEGIDLLYAQADELYFTAKFTEAIVLYNQIITDYPDDSRSIYAYIALYKINKTQNADSTVLNDLREVYNERLTQVTDTTLIRTISHLSNLCLVGVEKYNEAINEFDDIVQNNPNTNEAFFAEIDALTTSMIAGSDTTQLGKV